MSETANERVALITGANKGIGLQMSRQLAEQGFTVLVAARDLAKADAAVEELRQDGLKAEPLQLDVTKPDQIAAATQQIGDRYGHLDVLINNAGIMVESDLSANKTSTLPMAQLRETYGTNVFGLIELTQALLPLVRKSPAGRIVNLSSILGSLTLHADPKSPVYNSKAFAYNSSKTLVNAFTIHLAHELKETAIKVNSAHPGWVKTDMGGAAAPMEPADGAKTGVYLATLPADGPTGGYFHFQDRLPW